MITVKLKALLREDLTPKWIAGITNTIEYRNFDLSFTFYGEFGGKLYNSGGQYMSTSGGNGYDNRTVDQMNRWQNAR